MPESDPGGGATAGIAGIGVAAVAILCCAGPAAILGLAGGITLGAAIGGLAGLALIVAAIAAFLLIRRRRACESGATGEQRQGRTAHEAGTEAAAEKQEIEEGRR
jgi:hypothetical protein